MHARFKGNLHACEPHKTVELQLNILKHILFEGPTVFT
jgi:hypothetical protein